MPAANPEPSWFESIPPIVSIISLLANAALIAMVMRQRLLLHEDTKDTNAEIRNHDNWIAATQTLINFLDKTETAMNPLHTGQLDELEIKKVRRLLDPARQKTFDRLCLDYNGAWETADTSTDGTWLNYTTQGKVALCSAIESLRSFLLEPPTN